MTVRDHWKAFTFRQILEHIREAWDEVSPATASGVRRKLWPQVVLDEHKAVSQECKEAAVCRECVCLANETDLVEEGDVVQEEDVNELLQAYTQDLTDKDLIKWHTQQQGDREPETLDLHVILLNYLEAIVSKLPP